MKHLVTRFLIATWFLGMVFVAMWEMPVQGQAEGDKAKQFFPLLVRYASVQVDPDFREYMALVETNGIYTVRGDGSALRQLTLPEPRVYGSRFSSDGTHIAFLQFQGLARAMLMNRDGSGLRPVLGQDSGHATEFKWSPDGRQLLVAVGGATNFSLYKADLEGNATPIWGVPFRSLEMFGWSPTGEYLYYYYASATAGRALWVVPTDGGIGHLVYKGYVTQVAWHPSGKDLVVIGEENEIVRGHLVSADGNHSSLLFEGEFSFHGWMKGGEVVLLQSSTNGNLYTVERDGSMTAITNSPVIYGGVDSGRTGVLYNTTEASYWHSFGEESPRYLLPIEANQYVTAPSLASDGSGLLFSLVFEGTIDTTDIYYVHLQQNHPPVQLPLTDDQGIWGATFLPFASQRAFAQRINTIPQSSIPVMVDAWLPSTTPLPLPNSFFQISEWRYLP